MMVYFFLEKFVNGELMALVLHSELISRESQQQIFTYESERLSRDAAEFASKLQQEMDSRREFSELLTEMGRVITDANTEKR